MPPVHTGTLTYSSFGCRVGELPKFSPLELFPVGCQDGCQLDARTTETNLVLASLPLWVMKDIQPAMDLLHTLDHC